jgi:hypothetical protein
MIQALPCGLVDFDVGCRVSASLRAVFKSTGLNWFREQLFRSKSV